MGACSTSGPGDAGNRAAGSGKQVTLRLGARANGTPGDVGTDEFLAAKALFATKYPKINVEFVWAMTADKMMTAAAAGVGFDIQDLCCDQLPLEARAGILMKGHVSLASGRETPVYTQAIANLDTKLPRDSSGQFHDIRAWLINAPR